MEKEKKVQKNSEKNPKKDKYGLVDLGNGRKQIDWERIKLSFFLSSYRKARTFLVKENYFTEKEITSGHISRATAGWEIERRDWETQALEITMHNLRESKAVEMKDYLVEEGKVVKQLLNMTKIAMNNLLIKKKVKGEDILELKNTKGLKQVTESTLNILKYARDRLGITFGKEEEGVRNAINFNFDLISMEDFDPQQVINLFKRKDGQKRIGKSIETDSISAIPKTIKT